MAESLADDGQQSGSSAALASNSSSTSSSTPATAAGATTSPSASTATTSKPSIPNGITSPPQPPAQQVNGVTELPALSTLANESAQRDDTNAQPSHNGSLSPKSVAEGNAGDISSIPKPKPPVIDASSSSDAPGEPSGGSTEKSTKTSQTSTIDSPAEEVAEEGVVDEQDESGSSSSTSEKKKKSESKLRQKPGPSSDITAENWDGGIVKEDVVDNLDDLENAESEAESIDDLLSEKPPLDKGKSPLHSIAKDASGKTTSASTEKKKEKTKPLTLIDLPLDVLKEIVREVTNTTDLCSLCLTHSSLHAIAIPLIYSRFDIVWPDISFSQERSGVDALTYGLATLVSNENDYARYVRKFSLGNGPDQWVKEYGLDKEGSKMLGTLVSLAVWKMEILETFSWDMPSGIIGDVWRALHRLKTLRNIHVRWQDTTALEEYMSPQDAIRKIGRPTFSGFKELRSLSVLDLDELQFLREMAKAVEKSYASLRELRLGISVNAQGKTWLADESEPITSADNQEGMGEGGAMGILVSHICDVGRRPNNPASTDPPSQGTTTNNSMTQEQLAQVLQVQQQQAQLPNAAEADNSASTITAVGTSNTTGKSISKGKSEGSEICKQLRLETIELERVPISTRVLAKAFDFTHVVNLTLLGCPNQYKLFKALRRKYSPYQTSVLEKLNKTSAGTSGGLVNKPPINLPPPNYRLRLKKVHTDMVSNSLVEFLHQTLAPNTLETLFLQETAGDSYVSQVDLSQIVSQVLRRHRQSIQRLLIDSYVPQADAQADPNNTTVNNRKLKWCFNKDTISFVTMMPRLRELAFGISFEDWHYLMIRLPDMPALRSLYIPHVIDPMNNFHKADKQSDELSKMIVDVVTLRPECGICYVGIVNKCYELLEGDRHSSQSDPDTVVGANESDDDDDEEDSENEEASEDGNDEEGSEDGEDVDDVDDAISEADGSPDGTSTVLSPAAAYHPHLEEDEDPLPKKKRVVIDSREILFYDDKVAVFKARHARL